MIEIKKLSKTYNIGKVNEFKALKNISLTIENGEMVAIIGKSGAGKSTLLHIIACIDDYEKGEYLLNGKLLKSLNDNQKALIRNKDIGIIMQDFSLVDDFTCLENVLLPLDFSKNKITNKIKIAMKCLASVEMDKFSDKKVNQLSGGQKQRVAIARAIVNNPSIILADEPTGALDTKTSAEIMKLFKSLNQLGKTVIIVTHDQNIAEQCDRMIEILDGKISI